MNCTIMITYSMKQTSSTVHPVFFQSTVADSNTEGKRKKPAKKPKQVKTAKKNPQQNNLQPQKNHTKPKHHNRTHQLLKDMVNTLNKRINTEVQMTTKLQLLS